MLSWIGAFGQKQKDRKQPNISINSVLMLNVIMFVQNNYDGNSCLKNEITKLKNGNGGSDFYVDEGLLNKMLSKFEEPSKDEINVWFESN